MNYIFQALTIALVMFCVYGAAAVSRPAAAQEMWVRIYEATPRPRPPSAPRSANAPIFKLPAEGGSPSGKSSLEDLLKKQELAREHFEEHGHHLHDPCGWARDPVEVEECEANRDRSRSSQ